MKGSHTKINGMLGGGGGGGFLKYTPTVPESNLIGVPKLGSLLKFIS